MTSAPNPTTDATPFDRHMMAIALTMAHRGLGQTAPNPSVGAVIADHRTEVVLARATTAVGGRPHAETQAIASAGSAARGATIYVTLEPCSHHGQTGPCADAIIAAGIARVVCASEDPDPRVAGRGLDRLRAAGIEVVRGVAAQAARWETRGHIVRVTERRPFVVLKMALDAGGDIARGGDGTPSWVTGLEARQRGHLLRAQADAILIGSKTANDDNPGLTCRLPGLEARSPVRVVLSHGLNLNPDSQLATTARDTPVWLMTSQSAAASPQAASRRTALTQLGVEVIPVASVQDQVWLPSVMDALVSRGMTRLLVEGGPTMWRSFAQASLVDQVMMFKASAAMAAADDRELAQRISERLGLAHGVGLKLFSMMDVGADRLWDFRRFPSV